MDRSWLGQKAATKCHPYSLSYAQSMSVYYKNYGNPQWRKEKKEKEEQEKAEKVRNYVLNIFKV